MRENYAHQAQEPENVHDCDQWESLRLWCQQGPGCGDDDEEVDLHNHDGGGDVTVGGGEGKALVFWCRLAPVQPHHHDDDDDADGWMAKRRLAY